MDISTVRIEKPDDLNFILGQSHFIKTVEDLYEVLVSAVPGLQFGLAFCEASGPCLVRWAGNDDDLSRWRSATPPRSGPATRSSCSCARGSRSTC